jgi:hypothetical protein
MLTMTEWQYALLTAAAALLLYGAFVAWLLLASRREDARAVASFIPDCLLLFRRLITDDRVPHRRKLLLVALLGYLRPAEICLGWRV